MLICKYMDALCYMQALSVQFIAFLLIFKQNVHMDIVVTPPLHTACCCCWPRERGFLGLLCTICTQGQAPLLVLFHEEGVIIGKWGVRRGFVFRETGLLIKLPPLSKKFRFRKFNSCGPGAPLAIFELFRTPTLLISPSSF